MSRGRHEPRTFPRARDWHEEGERTTAPGMLRAAAAQCTPWGALPLLPSLHNRPAQSTAGVACLSGSALFSAIGGQE